MLSFIVAVYTLLEFLDGIVYRTYRGNDRACRFLVCNVTASDQVYKRSIGGLIESG